MQTCQYDEPNERAVYTRVGSFVIVIDVINYSFSCNCHCNVIEAFSFCVIVTVIVIC